MTKNTLVLRKFNTKYISTIAHTFGIIKNKSGYCVLKEFSETIPLNLLDKEINLIEEGKSVEEFHIDYSGKSYATKDAMKRCLKKSTGYEYIVISYEIIWNENDAKIVGYTVEAVRTDYLKPYVMSEKDKERLENKETRRLNKNLIQTFIIKPLAAALQDIDDRLHINEVYRCIIIYADVSKYLTSNNFMSATYGNEVTKANKEFFKLYNNTLKDQIIKAANALGLYNIEELSLENCRPIDYVKPLLKIRKVRMNVL